MLLRLRRLFLDLDSFRFAIGHLKTLSRADNRQLTFTRNQMIGFTSLKKPKWMRLKKCPLLLKIALNQRQKFRMNFASNLWISQLISQFVILTLPFHPSLKLWRIDVNIDSQSHNSILCILNFVELKKITCVTNLGLMQDISLTLH